jgi:hypothetical protein
MDHVLEDKIEKDGLVKNAEKLDEFVDVGRSKPRRVRLRMEPLLLSEDVLYSASLNQW